MIDIINKEIRKKNNKWFLSCDWGYYGHGDGYGNSDGDGYGDGKRYGDGDGDGDGDGNGYGKVG